MKTLQQKAEHHWMNVLDMAEPKYCANSVYEYFEKGFIAGALEERERARGLVKKLEQFSYQDHYWDIRPMGDKPGTIKNIVMLQNEAKNALKEYNEGVD